VTVAYLNNYVMFCFHDVFIRDLFVVHVEVLLYLSVWWSVSLDTRRSRRGVSVDLAKVDAQVTSGLNDLPLKSNVYVSVMILLL
jgi:hypothetical protein